MEKSILSIKKNALIHCGTCIAKYRDRHGTVCGRSSLSIKRMHRKGGGRAGFGKYSGMEKLLNQRVAARKVDLVPESISNCIGQVLKTKNKEVYEK